MIPRQQSRQHAIRQACSRLSGQPLRLVQYLATHRRGALTRELAAAIACSNISDAASRANREIEHLGLRVVACLPEPLTKNRFGEPSMQHRWSLERLPTGGG